jgi:hypothetical protein
MLKADIRAGIEYALREKPTAPLQRVRVLQHIRASKWKAEWIEPNSGLVHFVDSKHLLAPWKEHKAFLKEEADAARLDEHNERVGFRKDSPVVRAVEQVFECADNEVMFYQGVLSGQPEAIGRVATRAKLKADPSSPYGYTDRKGHLNLPFDVALDLAKAFCAAEPGTVLLSVESTERDWAHRVSRGDDYLVSLLNEYRASWALIRQWAGHDAALAQREAEIQKLERLVWDAIYALQKAGQDQEAARLRRAIERGRS